MLDKPKRGNATIAEIDSRRNEPTSGLQCSLVAALEQIGVRVCVDNRVGGKLEACSVSQVQISADADQRPTLLNRLSALGFLDLRTTATDGSDRFLGYDRESDVWLELYIDGCRDTGGPFHSAVGGRPAKLKGLTVAFLAPDGAGKSTVIGRLAETFYIPTQTIYMGLYQRIEKRSRFPRPPGLGFATRLTRQWCRFLRGRFQAACGRLVLFDRYSYDALLDSKRPTGPLRSLMQWLLAHSCPAPDLVIILDAPGDLLFARSGEHSVEFLEQQRDNYRQLQKRLPRATFIDATGDAEEVRRSVTACIWQTYVDRFRKEEVL